MYIYIYTYIYICIHIYTSPLRLGLAKLGCQFHPASQALQRHVRAGEGRDEFARKSYEQEGQAASCLPVCLHRINETEPWNQENSLSQLVPSSTWVLCIQIEDLTEPSCEAFFLLPGSGLFLELVPLVCAFFSMETNGKTAGRFWGVRCLRKGTLFEAFTSDVL